MTEIATPVVLIDETGYVFVHRSLRAARQAIEAVDVDDGAWTAYGGGGTLLALSTYGNLVAIELLAGSVRDAGELESRVRAFIQLVGAEKLGIDSPETATLPDLLEALAEQD